ncbi:hypothetical protein FE236_07065 [Mariprofundus erugo]|uniref:SPOR domain-containing protein n=1 Tax=Mariprofundus erugo TaxID=2528639 RepID=UPI0010FE92E4|nr:SPOR domain-containing protein [Mariprofundus erugo]TLS76384.1 hypothetical protein FE236_07065 [Mariprofundus erugo]
MGKHKGRSSGQIETDLFEAQQPSNSNDPMIDELQRQYDELLGNPEHQVRPQVSLDEMMFHLDGPEDAFQHLNAPDGGPDPFQSEPLQPEPLQPEPLQPEPLQPESLQQSEPLQSGPLLADSEQTVVHTTETPPPLSDSNSKASDFSDTTPGTTDHKDAPLPSQSDEVDGFFASFSEMSNSSAPSDAAAPFTGHDESPIEQRTASRSSERRRAGLTSNIAQPQSDADWSEYSFDDESQTPHEHLDTMEETYTDPPVRNRGNGLIIAATALSLIAAISGTIYWATSGPATPSPTDPAARAAAKEKLLADARASLAQQGTITPATTVPAVSTALETPPPAAASTAEQLQLAQAQLAEEKQRLAQAKSASEQQRLAAERAAAEKARAAAAAQQLAAEKARAEAEQQRLIAEKAAAEKARAAAAAQQLAAEKARAEAEQQRLIAAKAAAEKARAMAAAQKPTTEKTTTRAASGQQVTVAATQRPHTQKRVTRSGPTAIRTHRQQQEIIINDDIFAADEPVQAVPPATPTPAVPTIIAAAPAAAEPAKSTINVSNMKQAPAARPHTTTGWAIILSSTSSAKSARQYIARMKALGVETEATSDIDHGRVYHRILMTGFTTRQQAEQQLQSITRKLGIQGAKIEKI